MKILNNDLKANLSARRYELELYRKTHVVIKAMGWR
jgi:hypothetical protein